MFRTARRIAEHEERLASLALAVAEIRQALSQSTPIALRGLIDTLQGDVEAERARTRSEFGKLWYRLRRETPSPLVAPEEDPEFKALIAHQSAK